MNCAHRPAKFPVGLLFCPALLLALGCSAPEPPEPPPPVDDGAKKCAVAPPRLGGTAETRDLAAAAAHCGVPAFSWLASTDLGKVQGQLFPFGCTAPTAFDWAEEAMAFFEAHPMP